MSGNGDLPALILGSLVAAGGTYGYISKGSIPSGAAGLLVGSLYLYSGYRLQKGDDIGLKLALAASVLLAGSSIPRAIKTKKPLPAGLGLLATYGLVYYGQKVFGGAGKTKI